MSQPKESSLCTPHGELIEFLEGVAFQDLWNGRARDKFRAIVEVLKAAPSEKTPTELGAALKAKLDEAAPSAKAPHVEKYRGDSAYEMGWNACIDAMNSASTDGKDHG